MKQLTAAFEWLPGYGRQTFTRDLAAGLTVGAVLIPQGMAYALVAGLPPVAGLYASLFPIVAYALLGRSRQLAMGPVAIVSLLTAAGLEPLARGDAGEYAALAALLAVMVGILMVAMGVARLGFVADFLSHPVLIGFTSAAAFIIAASQLRHLMRVDLVRSEYVHEVVVDAISQLDQAHLLTFAIGSVGFVLLMVLRRWQPLVPWPLLVVLMATVAVSLFDLEERGVSVVGHIPRNLPAADVPPFERVDDLLGLSVAVTLVALVESLAMAKYFARKNRYKLKTRREFVALGAANVTAGFFGGYPVAGSFSRTAVNNASGARTPVAALITAGVIALTLLVAAPAFRPLPRAVLASVVFMAAASLIDVAEARRLWRVKRSDFALMVFTFVATLGLGVELGIAAAVVASLIVVLRQTTRPHTAILGRLPGTTHFRNVERSPDAVTVPAVVVLRIDAPLYFANADFLADEFRRVEAAQRGALRVLVLDCSSVTDLDSSADHALAEIVDDYAARGLDLYLANVKGLILDVMRRSGLYDRLGADHFFLSTDEAVRCAESVIYGTGEIHLAEPAEEDVNLA